MSWSVSFIGKPEKVIEALEANSTKLNGQSKEEFDNALPHLIGLLKLNFGPGYYSTVKLEASGHATKSEDPQYSYSTLNVKMEPLAGLLV